MPTHFQNFALVYAQRHGYIHALEIAAVFKSLGNPAPDNPVAELRDDARFAYDETQDRFIVKADAA